MPGTFKQAELTHLDDYNYINNLIIAAAKSKLTGVIFYVKNGQEAIKSEKAIKMICAGIRLKNLSILFDWATFEQPGIIDLAIYKYKKAL